MLYYNEATLIYAGRKETSDGSPYEVTVTRSIKVKEIKTFSLNYYLMDSENQRFMRKSKNLVAPKWVENDIVEDGVTYMLLYVIYNGLKYRVRNILKYYEMEQTRVILDVEQLR